MSSTIRTSRPSSGGVEVLEDPHDAGGLGRRAVGRDGHEVDLAGHVDVAHQVGEEEDGALQHADQQQVLALVVARDLRAQLAHAVLEVVGLDEDLADGFVAEHARRSLGARTSRCGVRRASELARTRARRSIRGAQPSADVQRAVLARARGSRPRGDPTAGAARRASASRCTRAGRSAGGSARRTASGGGSPASASTASTAASSTSASSRSSSSVRSTFASAAGCSSRSAGRSSWRGAVARVGVDALVGSSRHGSPRSRAVRRGLARA